MRQAGLRCACLLAVVAACGGDQQSNPDAGGGHDAAPADSADSGVPTSITFTLRNLPTTPSTFGYAVAFQDGSGPWQAPPPADTSDTYTFTVYSSTWSFAWTCATPNDGKTTPQVNVFGAAVTERTSFSQTVPAACTDRVTSPVTLTVNVTNLPATPTGTYYATFAGVTSPMTPGATGTGSFTISVAPGKHDLVVGHNANTVTSGAGSTDVVTDLAFVQRSLNLTASQTVPVDFSQAVATQSVVVTSSDPITSTTTLLTGDNTAVKLGIVSASPYASIALATSQGLGTDLYAQQLSSAATGASALVQTWSAAPTAATFAAPTALGTLNTSEPTTTPYPILVTSWSAYANAIGYRWQVTQPATGTATVAWTALLMPGFIGASPAYQVPDLSAIAGWSASLGLAVGTPLTIRASALTSSVGSTDFPFAARPAAGTQRTQLTSTMTLTP